MIRSFHILFFLLWITSTFAQQQIDTLPRLNLAKIAHINQSDSYITFPTDIGNMEPLMIEANLKPNFVVRKRITILNISEPTGFSSSTKIII